MKQCIWIVVAVLAAWAAGCSRKAAPSSDTGQSVGVVWMTDFEAAKQKAAVEGKDLLVNFSGSDWCYWCQRLDKEVFSDSIFAQQAGQLFVFVLIDFPRDKSGQSPELQSQNRQLAEAFHIQGYPTVILMRADGTSYAETGYEEGGPSAYLLSLRQLLRQK